MNLNLKTTYTGIQFMKLDGSLVPEFGPKKLINSPQINNELLAMLHGSNFEDTSILLDQLAYLNITNEELEVLASIGVFQLDQQVDDKHCELFEYRTLLDTHSIISINIPDDIIAVRYFTNESVIASDNEDGWIYFDKLNSKKLLLSVESPSEISTLSEELHNMMINPHNDQASRILKRSDLVKELIDDVIIDNVNLQTNTQLCDYTEQSSSDEDTKLIGDTGYIKVIPQELTSDNKSLYIISVNQVPKYKIYATN